MSNQSGSLKFFVIRGPVGFYGAAGVMDASHAFAYTFKDRQQAEALAAARGAVVLPCFTYNVKAEHP